MDVTTVNKTVELQRLQVVKVQLIIHCFLNEITLNETEMNCLALLGVTGECRLSEFCKLAAQMELLGNPTAVNNCLVRVEKSKLFIKKGAGKKMIFLNPELNIQTKGNIVLNYKMYSLESDKIEGADKKNSGAPATVS